ncbi:Vacuolar protein sorting-associated protein atg6 [Lachnellula suecica]|uniref:Vacuolar protein sorting-associated protein atg6 n=1 Tax=Lachnellula suecica TaxID=602035 RepID=A0A8T9CG48_9HELO|nr:Vacuolar protein sorting-associated protein atg6 [Lachnellula suecica]
MYCQKCRTPLKLDSSLEDLNPAAFDLLVGASSQQHSKNIPSLRPAYPQERKQLYDRVSKNAGSPTFKRHITAPRRSDTASSDNMRSGIGNPAMSFVMLTESQVVPPSIVKSPEDTNPKKKRRDDITGTDGAADDEGKAMSQDMERVSRLFEILSARSDIDHPVCVECTEMLVEGLQKRLETATKERDAYVGFLKQVNADIPTDEEVKESQEQLAEARADEAAAIEELKKLEKEKAGVDEEIAALEEEARALDAEEEKFWSERNAFGMKLAEFQNVRDSVNQQYDHDTQLLEKLQRTNVYNDTFCISHDGRFGTINGLRLGRLSNVPVDWPEINAAWGHTLLLLATVAEKLGYKFDGYELQPMGSTSRIIRYDYPSPSASRAGSQRLARLPKKSILELYSSGDMPLGLTFMHRRFDIAMEAFLECMRQVGAFVERESARNPEAGRVLSLPYKIEGEKIGDVSIKLGIAQDDAWSRACKFTLTCCKFLLAHASNINGPNGRRA